MKKGLYPLAVLPIVAFAAMPAQAKENRVIEIINNTRHTMTHFYASNVGTNNWEEDILGRDTLPSGESVYVNIDDGRGWCKFDLFAKFKDGYEARKNNVNVCAVDSWTIYDED